jgi:hypothetical protein
MHQTTVGNLLRTLMYTNPSHNMADTTALIETALTAASHALRATVHPNLGLSPGAIIFARDIVFLDIFLLSPISYNFATSAKRSLIITFVVIAMVGECVFELINYRRNLYLDSCYWIGLSHIGWVLATKKLELKTHGL